MEGMMGETYLGDTMITTVYCNDTILTSTACCKGQLSTAGGSAVIGPT